MEITLAARNGHVPALAAHSPQHFDLLWGSCLLGYSCDRIINGGDLSSSSQGGHGPQVWLVELSFPGLRLWTRVAPKGSQWVEAREPACPLSPRLGPAGMLASESAFLPLLGRHLCTSAYPWPGETDALDSRELELLFTCPVTPSEGTPPLRPYLLRTFGPQRPVQTLPGLCSQPECPAAVLSELQVPPVEGPRRQGRS